MTSSLFTHIATLQGDTPWGDFLDAGTGVNSSLWATGLMTERWTGVTAAVGHADQVRTAVGDRLRSQDRLLVGNWVDPALLEGQVYDTVLADYLIGAVEGFSPYFQSQMLRRLRPLVRRRLYVVGLDPYVIGPADTAEGRLVREIGRLRDAVLLLADETPYREFPAEWTVNVLNEAGFRVISARRFPNRYRARWVNGQLDMATRRLERLADRALAGRLADTVEEIRTRGLALCHERGGLRHGSDYVIAAEPTAL
ncbi:MAG: hypothetical protein EON91_00065 [Brevundimonas sp.]|uniref:hypothetical protein n=1 Tax=Brevundimonas sp. TaxID=1871086 RepID=UPI0011F5F275|nr:hypothetical protein [Brevundimonas sp.]RZJ19663.1 MAG: hypothetical protein EON91_00065 [Brevundimonas sp.]